MAFRLLVLKNQRCWPAVAVLRLDKPTCSGWMPQVQEIVARFFPFPASYIVRAYNGAPDVSSVRADTFFKFIQMLRGMSAMREYRPCGCLRTSIDRLCE